MCNPTIYKLFETTGTPKPKPEPKESRQIQIHLNARKQTSKPPHQKPNPKEPKQTQATPHPEYDLAGPEFQYLSNGYGNVKLPSSPGQTRFLHCIYLDNAIIKLLSFAKIFSS